MYLGYGLDIYMSITLYIFQVMVQRHNRHMSFSLYISVLAITDTISLLIGRIYQVLILPFSVKSHHD